MSGGQGRSSRYVCMSCGVLTYVSSWEQERSFRSACRGCGSHTLLASNDPLAQGAPANPDVARATTPFQRHKRTKRRNWATKPPAEQEAVRLARTKRLHADFMARKKHGLLKPELRRPPVL